MPNWPSIEAFVDGVIAQTFGEPVVYQPVQAGAAHGSAFTVTAVRHLRPRDESGAMASFEEISVNASDFANPPAKGDWVTAWGTQYVVTTVRQPDAYGMLNLALLQRS
jgi:hypothetical protein